MSEVNNQSRFVKIFWSDQKFTTKENSVIILIDTLRASSVIPAALYSGAKKVFVLKDSTEALEMKRQDKKIFLAGERSGKILDGFDCGNSPIVISKFAKNKDVVLTTGNFCSVIDEMVSKNSPLLAASLVNANAVAKYVLKNGYENIYLVATGTYHMKGRRYKRPLRTEEDILAAVYIAYELSKDKRVNKNNEIDKYESLLKDKTKLAKYLKCTQYSNYLIQLDKDNKNKSNEKDIDICFSVDHYPCVPVLFIEESKLFFRVALNNSI